ncbi:hypothetical protein ACFV1W_05760 [Kitasatospora sp. NPDC059648]|uniref:hypothetical protein n=1 Tax=Kitasatospora sp. NPDC059648 TaxID=3346894 RepID=UPI0036846E89
MNRDQLGRLIGSGFGLVFVEANAGALPTGVAVPLRAVGVAVFLALVLLGRRRPQAAAESGGEPRGEPGGASFGGRYWLVVVAEVVAIAVGLAVINKVLHTPQATVGWIALVIGVHFFGLAVAWQRPALRLLGAGMAACGALGMVLAFCGAPAAVVALVAGIVPGAMLFASVWWSGRAVVAPGRTG